MTESHAQDLIPQQTKFPPEPAVINVFGGDDGLKFLEKQDRQIIYNLINARGAEVLKSQH